MNSNTVFNFPAHFSFAKFTNFRPILLLTCGLLLSCGGEEATEVDFESELDSPLAADINDGVLVDNQPGQLPDSNSERPQIDLGPRRFADSNVILSIEADVTAVEGSSISGTLWTQVSGPEVELPNPRARTLSIITPFVAVTRILEFRLTALDDQDRINSRTVAVVVRPLDSPISVIGGVFDEIDLFAEFVINLADVRAAPTTINYVVRSGSALVGEDFEFVSGVVEIPAGSLSTTVNVPLIDDDLIEEDESFSLQAVATDGDDGTSFANTGPAIIRNGIEPAIEQVIEFVTDPVALFVGDIFSNTFLAGAEPQGDGLLMYVSSNPTVASVDTNGQVTALLPGNAEITAIQGFDDVFRSGEASYQVQVSAIANTPPSIEFTDIEGLIINSASITGLVGPDIVAQISDQEDGSLPTAAQLAEFESTGVPIAAYNWSSDIDGDLGNGHLFPLTVLSPGHHIISFTANDSEGAETIETIDLLVSNIAQLGLVTANSEYCEGIDPSDCFVAANAVDTQLNRGLSPADGWAAELEDGSAEISIDWPQGVRIEELELYTADASPIRDFIIEGQLGAGSPVQIANVTGNTDSVLRFPLVNLNVSTLTIRALSGPDTEPSIARINEIAVFGNVLLPQDMVFDNAGPVALFVGDSFFNGFATGNEPLGTGDLIFSSSNPTVASVDTLGNVLALAAGTTTITATKLSDAEYQEGDTSYVVNVSVLLPQDIAFDNTGPIALLAGDSFFNGFATGFEPLGTGDLIFASSNPAVASVDATGNVNALAAGTATITATKLSDAEYQEGAASYVVNVSVLLPQDIAFDNAGPVALFVGNAFLNGFATGFEPLGDGELIFSSSNPTVASVDATGNVNTLAAGTTTITATKLSDAEYQEGAANYIVNVSELLAQDIAFDNTGPVALFVGDAFLNGFATGFEPLGTGDLIFVSSNPGVASVDATGNVNALAAGTTTITATKLSDTEYQEGAASYVVNVSVPNTLPVVEFVDGDGGSIQSASITGTRLPDITPRITDAEDGTLPTATQLAEFAATGIPLSEYSWESSIDGNIGDGHLFPAVDLSPGHHTIRFSAADSEGDIGSQDIDLFVSNVAQLATPISNSIYCINPDDRATCYLPFRAVDTSIDSGSAPENAWAAEIVDGEVSIELSWSNAITISDVEIYTTTGLEIRDFVVEGLDLSGSLVWSIPVSGNTDTVIALQPPVSLTTTLRIRASSGSDAEPNIARINEIIVIGNTALLDTAL